MQNRLRIRLYIHIYIYIDKLILFEINLTLLTTFAGQNWPAGHRLCIPAIEVMFLKKTKNQNLLSPFPLLNVIL